MVEKIVSNETSDPDHQKSEDLEKQEMIVRQNRTCLISN
ncbi:hypothetical protein C943_03651 [Mariniradius saccharolyticus AK6]|uniref:Uncharacterized protein n=1 Tax=Mariniradius saccharolyticus AK6 TaxID=1239962 RepID=M7Y129_9BACT|nr:hypothetical protein C943_03651 [Mariniradius saccharolyticus AK6]